MNHPLRIGVIGLGSRWRQRYQPALAALPTHFQVHALCDQVRSRAEREARRLGCRPVPGPGALFEIDEIDAVLLLDAQWFRLWPMEIACLSGKPVFCACPLELDNAHADSIVQQVRDSRLPVMIEMAPRLAPATAHLRHIVQTEIGPPRLVICDAQTPTPAGPGNEAAPLAGGPLDEMPGAALVDWCLTVLGSEPVKVQGAGGGGLGLSSLYFECGKGRAIQVNRRLVPGGNRVFTMKVVAERGCATVRLPDRVSWTTPEGKHIFHIRGGRPVGQVLLEEFHEAVTAGRPPRPNLEDAYRILTWLRAAVTQISEVSKTSEV